MTTDEQTIEQIAQAMFERGGMSWEDATDQEKHEHRLDARAAASVIAEKIAEVERALRIRIWNECKTSGMNDRDAYRRIEEEIAALSYQEGASNG